MHEAIHMAIHHDYKNRRGEKKLRKQHKRDMRRIKNASSKSIPQQEQNSDTYVASPDEVITLDLITNPDKNK